MQEEDRRDLELQRRLRAADRGAFEELYRRYAAAAHGLALRVTGREVLAQEVVHDAFLALWRAPEAYDPARGSSGPSSCPSCTTGPWTRSAGSSASGDGPRGPRTSRSPPAKM